MTSGHGLVDVVQPRLGFGDQVAAAQLGIRAYPVTEQLLHVSGGQVDGNGPVGQLRPVVLERQTVGRRPEPGIGHRTDRECPATSHHTRPPPAATGSPRLRLPVANVPIMVAPLQHLPALSTCGRDEDTAGRIAGRSMSRHETLVTARHARSEAPQWASNGIRCREAGSAQTATGGAWPTRINDPRLPRRATPRNQKLSERWRARYEGSFAQDFVRGLGAVDFGDRIIIFGACLLLSVLPLIIVVSTYASHRIDDDIATHLGLSAQGIRIVEGLFTASNTSFNLSVLVGLLLSFVGTIAVARSVEMIYERAFEYPPLTRGQGWLRCTVWVAVVAAVAIADAAIGKDIA